MDLKALWMQIVQELSEHIDRNKLITWFKNTAILEVQQGVITIGLPLPVFLQWHATHFSQLTLKAAQKGDPSLQKIAYQVDLSLTDQNPRVIDLAPYFPEKHSRKLPYKNEVKLGEGIISKMFNPKYTLDNFIVAPENRLAHAVCLNVAKTPGQTYNPFFIYGGVGLGKTHLLQGTGKEILRHDPRRTVLYATSEIFVNDVVHCIQNRNTEKLRHKYRQVDVLIIDDIQFIINKDRSQEEFFHIFNTLYESGKQIILSSDLPPQKLTLMDSRLTSRFEAGMIVDVKMPDYETRLAILQQRCQQSQMVVNPQVLEFIATHADRSVRLLEGVLTQAFAKYELEHMAPTVNMVSEILGNEKEEVKPVGFIENDSAPRAPVTLERLIDCVSGYYTIPKAEMTGDSRLRECTLPRQIVMYLAKTKLRMSLQKIGENLGRRNHTTVMHAIHKITDQLKNDRQLLCDVNAIAHEAGMAA